MGLNWTGCSTMDEGMKKERGMYMKGRGNVCYKSAVSYLLIMVLLITLGMPSISSAQTSELSQEPKGFAETVGVLPQETERTVFSEKEDLISQREMEPIEVEYINHKESWKDVENNHIVLTPRQNTQIRLKGEKAKEFGKKEIYVRVELNGVELPRITQSIENEYARISRLHNEEFYYGVYLNGQGKKGTTTLKFFPPDQDPIELTLEFADIEDPGIKIEAKSGEEWKDISEKQGSSTTATWEVERSKDKVYVFRARMIPEDPDIKYEFSVDQECLEAISAVDKETSNNEFYFKAIKEGEETVRAWIGDERVEVTIRVVPKSQRTLSLEYKQGQEWKVLGEELDLQSLKNNRYELRVRGAEGEVTWENSNPEVLGQVLSEDKELFVFDVLKSGESTVTVKEGDLVAKVKINVKKETPILKYKSETGESWSTVGEEGLTLIKGQKIYIFADVEGQPNLVWRYTHDNTGVIEAGHFLKIGTIVALNEGEAVFTATSGEYSVSARVVVHGIPATKVEISSAYDEVMVSETLKFQSTIQPADTTDKLQWGVDHPDLATIDENGVLTALKEGEVVVHAKAGEQVATKKIRIVEKYEPKVYFKNKDGSKKYLGEDNVITLTVLDEGDFYLEGDQVKATHWHAREKYYIDKEEKEFAIHFWIDKFNRFYPRKVGRKDATVTYKRNGRTYKKTFTLEVVPSHIEEIKAFVGDRELSMEDPIEVQGSQRTWIKIKGRLSGQQEFRDIPETAYTVKSQHGQHIIGSSFALWRPETFTINVFMKDDPGIECNFKAKSNYVKVDGLIGELPSTWPIDAWNKAGEKFNGLRWYDTLQKGYTLRVSPENASIQDLKWEALTPEIAEYDPLHSNGIVPKKPGIARFNVSSVDNPKVRAEVQVEFFYKNALKSVTSHPNYVLNVGETQNLELNIEPQNASEQRFVWSYDVPNVVQVTDTVHVDPDNVETPKWTTHLMRSIRPGRVTVTGTPYDQTQGAEPVVFVVEVRGLGEENGIKDLDEVLNWAQNKMAAITKEYTSYEETKDYWKIAEIGKLGKEIKQKDLDYLHKGLFEDAALTDDMAILSKSVLALRAAGIDPEQYYGQNLIKKLCKLKIPDNIYRLAPYLWALSSDSYSVPYLNECIDESVAQILSLQDTATGLWGGEYWSDATGFALYALAPYYGREEVKSAVERAVEGISERQDASGSIADNSNSLVMVAGGLWSSNPAYLTDARLVKNGKTMLHALKEYDVVSSYEFLWQKNSDFGKPMATEQAYRSLIAYFAGNTFDYRNSSKQGIGDLDVEREREKVVLREKLEAVEAVLKEESLYEDEQIKQLREEAKNAKAILADQTSTKEELKQKSLQLERLLTSLRKKETPGGSSEEDMITVSFTLKGMERQGSSEQVWIPKTEYKIPIHSKVVYVFDKALKNNDIDYHNAGNYISKIKSPLDNEWLAELDNGKYSGWMYTVNGEHVKYGLEEYELHDGDEVVWHYTNDYRKEETPSGFGGGSGSSSQPLQEGSTKVKVELSNDVAKPILDEKFKNMLEWSIEEVKHQEKPTVFVDLIDIKGAKEVQMQLDKDVFETLTKRKELGFGIKSDLLILSFDSKAVQILAQMQKNAGKNIEIRVGKVENITEVLQQLSNKKQATPLSAKSVEQIAAKIGKRPVFELKTEVGKTTISDYKDGSMKVTLPYKLQAGETKEKMTVYHIGEDGKLTQLKDVVYDAVAGEMTFKTNHLSYYGIGEKQAQEELALSKQVSLFSDVVEGQWYAKAIYDLAEKQILKGREDGTFAPEANITRAEFITMLANHAGADVSLKGEEVFSDVGKESWYYASVMWAKQNAVVSGEGERFRPDSPITREEMAVILNNYAVYHLELELMKVGNVGDFADEAKIHSWAKDAVKTMQVNGIIFGKGANRFEPAAKANRAEAAQMVYQLLQK